MLCIKNESALRTMAEGGRILASAMEMLGASITGPDYAGS